MYFIAMYCSSNSRYEKEFLIPEKVTQQRPIPGKNVCARQSSICNLGGEVILLPWVPI